MRKDTGVKVTRMTPAQKAAMQEAAQETIRRFGYDRHNPRCGSNKKVAK